MVVHSILDLDYERLLGLYRNWADFSQSNGIVVVELAKSEDYVFLRGINFNIGKMVTVEVSGWEYQEFGDEIISRVKDLIGGE